ncbi:MAG: universal stress protein [Legionella sp.]|nr:universal stress protein [Legionella sp.]
MYTNILCATDLSVEHNHYTEKAAAIAKQLRAKLYLLHVIELPASIQIAQGLGFTELAHPVKDDARTVLSLIGENLGIPPDQQLVEIGSIKEHIFDQVEILNCQLIIIGSQSKTGFSNILGSTAHAVVNHAPCDVLTLRVQK